MRRAGKERAPQRKNPRCEEQTGGSCGFGARQGGERGACEAEPLPFGIDVIETEGEVLAPGPWPGRDRDWSAAKLPGAADLMHSGWKPL